MVDVEKILLSRKERRLLKHIEKNGLWEDDKRTKTMSFKVLNSYGLLNKVLDERFPTRYTPKTNVPESNCYKTVSGVSQYWKYTKREKSEGRKGLYRDVALLVIGGLVTVAFEHIGEILAVIGGIFQHG